MSKNQAKIVISLPYKFFIEDLLVSVYFINNELKFIEDRDFNEILTLRIFHI